MKVNIFDTNNKYKVIYADPPWKYNDRRNTSTKFGGGALLHYPVMPVQEIEKLPINQISEENSILFLWATFPCLPEAMKVMKSWGFKYKTLGFSWIKTNKKNKAPCFGIGFYTKSNCEVCLIGVKGRVKPVSNGVSSVIISERREHSRKPDETRDKIVQLMGDVPRIELFSRQIVDGWHCWGNEV